jgi:hypothetical protein
MVNTFVTPSALATRGLATLYEQTPMLPLVYTDLTSQFSTQKIGNTINVRKPATFTALDFDRSVGIQPQDATESTIPVVLNKIADVSFVVTSEQLSLSIQDFGVQLLDPAMQAIAQKIDLAILALRSDVTQVAGTDSATSWDKPEVLIEAGRLLDLKSVPTQDRVAVIGPSAKAKWLNTDLLKHADKSGSTAALREGSIGRDLFGFETFWTQNVGQPAASPAIGQPTTEIGLAFHKTAFAFASAPLEVAPGSNAAVMNYKGISIRVAYDYDIKYKQTVCSVDTLYGVKTLDANRAVLLKGANRTV